MIDRIGIIFYGDIKREKVNSLPFLTPIKINCESLSVYSDLLTFPFELTMIRVGDDIVKVTIEDTMDDLRIICGPSEISDLELVSLIEDVVGKYSIRQQTFYLSEVKGILTYTFALMGGSIEEIFSQLLTIYSALDELTSPEYRLSDSITN